MVTLDGKLYEKSSAITGGYVKKSMFGFGQSDDKELERAKAKLDELQKKYDTASERKESWKISLKNSNSLFFFFDGVF